MGISHIRWSWDLRGTISLSFHFFSHRVFSPAAPLLYPSCSGPPSMARAWLVNSRGIAKKIKNGTVPSRGQLKDWGADANKECPNCHHYIDNSDDKREWPGLPAGVKFDPSDVELLKHLSAKIGLAEPHVFLDEFIPTLEDDDGICCTHPENLPGARKDGTSIHFFHKTFNAYLSGRRKRRKINNSGSQLEGNVRWHKTGKTKAIIENGVHKGCKKIMVLYKSTKKSSKPKKSNWVMHQYHLGSIEEENEGEYVVSKIFYQQQPIQKVEKNDDDIVINEDAASLRWSPITPKTQTPQPPSRGILDDELDEDIVQESLPEKITGSIPQTLEACFDYVDLKSEKVESPWYAEESQAVDEPDANNMDDGLLCHEILDYDHPHVEAEYNHFPLMSELNGSKGVTLGRIANQPCGLSDLDNLELDTPPDFELWDLQFSSQDSVFDWIDRL